MAFDRDSPYRPLDQAGSQFRLLRILDSDQNHIQCELNTFSLVGDDVPTFNALSYRWGDDGPGWVVRLGNYTVSIQKNLYIIMTQMVIEKRRDWMFIDALCIDQENESEKPGQVSLMGEVYRRAEAVLAWLVYEPHGGEDGRDWSSPVYYANNMKSKSRSDIEEAILGNSYWTRVWIVQEVLLANCLIIRMGGLEIDWLALLPEKGYFQARPELPKSTDHLCLPQEKYANKKTRQTALDILSHRRFKTRALRAGSRLPFHKAFRFFPTQRCGRPHDKVFGLSGLTNSRITVDYSLSVLDLFVATLADYLLSAGLNTDDHTPTQKRVQLARGHNVLSEASDLIAPLLAFDLDLYDAVVYLLFCQVVKYFAPGFEERLVSATMESWWVFRHSTRPHHQAMWELDIRGFIGIGPVCVKYFKSWGSDRSACSAKSKELAARDRTLAEHNIILVEPTSGVSRRYSEWAEHAKANCEKMWQRFQESGEDIDGELDEESWTMIA